MANEQLRNTVTRMAVRVFYICFYLRLLRVNVRGPNSFQEFKTINKAVCPTYREARQKLVILENYTHWETTQADASNTALPQ